MWETAKLRSDASTTSAKLIHMQGNTPLLCSPYSKRLLHMSDKRNSTFGRSKSKLHHNCLAYFLRLTVRHGKTLFINAANPLCSHSRPLSHNRITLWLLHHPIGLYTTPTSSRCLGSMKMTKGCKASCSLARITSMVLPSPIYRFSLCTTNKVMGALCERD